MPSARYHSAVLSPASQHPPSPDRVPVSCLIRRAVELDAIARKAVVQHQAAPCAAVATAFRSHGAWHIAEGAYGVLYPGGPEAHPESPFDLASVTKPFCALTLARLVRKGLLALSTPLGALVQEALGTPSAQTPIELLLAHRSGLDGHRPLYEPLEQGRRFDRYQALQQAAMARRPECTGPAPAHGFPPTYSDLGYLLLGEAMARASAQPLDALVRSEVCDPLGCDTGSARWWRKRDPYFDLRVAPTEDVPWRAGVLRGVVHDENAWALAGYGMCAHAGLFGPARDVARLGCAVLDVLAGRRTSWLSQEDIEPLLRKRPGASLRAGFDGKSPAGSSAGSVCSDETFGHLGFTGTSLWIDPVHSVVVVLLTNRVHPTRASDAIRRARPAVHDDLFRFGIDAASR